MAFEIDNWTITSPCTHYLVLRQGMAGSSCQAWPCLAQGQMCVFSHVFYFGHSLLQPACKQHCHSHTLQYYTSRSTARYHPYTHSSFPREAISVQTACQKCQKPPFWALFLRKFNIWISTSKANDSELVARRNFPSRAYTTVLIVPIDV